MEIYYKFKSALDFNALKIDGQFISVSNVKKTIFETKKYGNGSDVDFVLSNAQTNEEYIEEETIIPNNTSILVRRIPSQPRLRFVANNQLVVPKVVEKTIVECQQPSLPQVAEGDDFGDDVYTVPEVVAVPCSYVVQDTLALEKADEDRKIKAMIESSALEWQTQPQGGFGRGMAGRRNGGRGFGQCMGGRTNGGRGIGQCGGYERKTPPEGYVCHRCNTSGHFIQHCPTNGDPNYDRRVVKKPTGIPKSMLIETTDGSYALGGGAVAVFKPNETAFDREVEGISSSSRSSGCVLPPELHCPLCREVMKDAMLASKCCFNSFCDKCIRNHIISKAACVCGATNVLADDLLPNKTVRDTINRILESDSSSSGSAGSVIQVQDPRCDQPKAVSPSLSVAPRVEDHHRL
ncbi:hypothetical protein IFM89_024373 [Coptis chinensis]|uniref:DWNN domain-containing protein n=1 Tax=Coptis chinensis TaxID=261450 RepID=A0A835MAP5_9MAGN|nr:hypothetical protein IFM89_024373 [Coptis chinensis]